MIPAPRGTARATYHSIGSDAERAKVIVILKHLKDQLRSRPHRGMHLAHPSARNSFKHGFDALVAGHGLMPSFWNTATTRKQSGKKPRKQAKANKPCEVAPRNHHGLVVLA